MAVIPTNGLSLSLASVRNLIAHCPTWRSWTGVDQMPEEDQFDAAKRRVHFYAFPPPEQSSDGYNKDELEILRPIIAISTRPPATVSRSQEIYIRNRSATGSFIEMYTNYIYVFADVPEELRANAAEAYLDFSNRIGGLIDDLVDLESDDLEDVPFVQAVALASDIARCSADYNATKGDFMEAFLRISTGLKR